MSEKCNAAYTAEKKKRTFDQMASMHFRLSDYYKKLSTAEDAVEIVVSVVLCGVTFIDYRKIAIQSYEWASYVVGFISIFLFAFTLIKQRLSHKQLAEKHELSGKMYAQAKLDISAKINEWELLKAPDEIVNEYISAHYASLNDLPQKPERKFNKLKHWHQSKVEFSKFLDNHKTEYWLLCKIKFRLSGKGK